MPPPLAAGFPVLLAAIFFAPGKGVLPMLTPPAVRRTRPFIVTLRVSSAQLAAIDRLADLHGETRAATLRLALRSGIDKLGGRV